MAERSNRNIVLVVIGVLAALLLVAAVSSGLFDRRREPNLELAEQLNPTPPKVPSAPSLNEALGIDASEMVEVGGVMRPKRDVEFGVSTETAALNDTNGSEPDAANAGSKPDPFTKSLFPFAGKVPDVPADTNPQVSGLFKELASENPPDAARSALFAPEPFDRKAYEADRGAYLNQIRPGRVYEPAQPGPEVKRLESRSPMFQHVVQGEKVVLEVTADPGMPVTFYTPQVGEFENRLTTYSVAANEEGVAKAVYTLTPGSQGIVDVLAASPVHSGQLQFKIRVELAD